MFLVFGLLILFFKHGEPLLSDLLQRDSTARALPVQMDMASEGGITICTGQTRKIACRDGANLAVTNAFWGRISEKVCQSDDGDPVTDCLGSKDTLPLVKKKCEGEKECSLSAKHKELQNEGVVHCAGVNKYLVVNYTCEPESQGVTLCDSVETDLFCRAGWIMDLADVFWGRRAGTKTCGGDGEIECDSSESASQYLKKKCNGQNKCHVKADADVLDPKKHSSCNGILKYLMVNYVCRPKDKVRSQIEETKDDSSKEFLEMLNRKPTEESAARGISAIKPASPSVAINIGKSKKTSFEGSISSSYKNIKKDETPLNVDDHEGRNIITEESLGHEDVDTKGETKTNIPEAKPASEDKIELSEPNTVRSILDRAKEVLKTLDYDSADSNEIAKRGGITRKDEHVVSSKFVNETAKAVKQVAALAQTLVKHAEAKAMMKTKTQNLLKKTLSSSNNENVSMLNTVHSANAKSQIPAAAAVSTTEKKAPINNAQIKRSGFIMEPAQFGNTP